MTATELATEADCTTERVEELARAGIIPGLKWGRSWRFAVPGIVADLAALARREAANRKETVLRAIREASAARAAKDGRRRAAKMQRTPPWADTDAIRTVYREAQRLTRETGLPHHVDHEIPLQGRLVSGLHVQSNLQILTGSENSRKGNRFDIEQ